MTRRRRGAAYYVSLQGPPDVYWPKGGATSMQFLNALRECLGLAPIDEETAHRGGRGRSRVRPPRGIAAE